MLIQCVFCMPPTPEALIGATPRFQAKLDPYPVSAGHALIIPRRHVVSLFDLVPSEIAEAFDLVEQTRDYIAERLHPDGWNIGINDGVAAGRTIHHTHIHLIPRYDGDVPDPRGGVRNILPGPSPDLWSTAPETIGELHDRLPAGEWTDLPEYGILLRPFDAPPAAPTEADGR